MANEVSFFHAVRKMSIENSIKELEMIIQAFDWSKEYWKNNPTTEYIDYYYEQKDKLEKLRESLKKCEEELNEAISNKQ